jgi:hypothetical protein
MNKRLLLVAVILLVLPTVAGADSKPPDMNVWNPSILSGPLLTCTGPGFHWVAPSSATSAYSTAINPQPGFPICSNLTDLESTFLNIIYFGIGLVIWILAPIAFVIGGVMYMLAGANPGLESTAKKALKGTLIGVVIVLCAYAIISTFVSCLGITGVGGFGINACP